ncbi:MAG: hypothetical protein AAF492_32765, partial [Verrucomicrobiota bacterium]
MKKALCGLLLLLSANLVRAEPHVLGKYTNYDKSSGYVVYSMPEFNKVSQWLRAEAANFTRAQRLAQSAWYKENEDESYPGKLVRPRTLKRTKIFPSKDKAERELERLELKAEQWEEYKNRERKEEMPKFRGRDAKRQRQNWLEEQKQIQEMKAKQEEK